MTLSTDDSFLFHKSTGPLCRLQKIRMMPIYTVKCEHIKDWPDQPPLVIIFYDWIFPDKYKCTFVLKRDSDINTIYFMEIWRQNRRMDWTTIKLSLHKVLITRYPASSKQPHVSPCMLCALVCIVHIHLSFSETKINYKLHHWTIVTSYLQLTAVAVFGTTQKM